MLTENEILQVKELHGKKTLNQIREIINRKDIKYTIFRRICQRLGLFRNRLENHIGYKYSHNRNYFRIPTLVNCYYAGLIAADGCILIDKHSGCRFCHKVAVKDEIIIDNLIKELNHTGKKIYSQSKSPHSDNISKLVEIRVNCFNDNASYLKQYFNIEPNKTFRLGPINLTDKQLIMAFLCGSIDGDGSIEYKTQNNYESMNISFNSSSKDFIQWIEKTLNDYFPVLPGKRIPVMNQHKKDKYYRIYIGGLRAAIIIDTLSRLNVPKLARKWENPLILQYIQKQKLKFPHYFKESNIETV